MRSVSEWHAEDLQHLIGASFQPHIMLHDGNETVGTNDRINLYSDSVLGCTPELFDFEVLLEPLEEQLYLPTVLVEVSNLQTTCRAVNSIALVRNMNSRPCSTSKNRTSLRCSDRGLSRIPKFHVSPRGNKIFLLVVAKFRASKGSVDLRSTLLTLSNVGCRLPRTRLGHH